MFDGAYAVINVKKCLYDKIQAGLLLDVSL